MILPTYYFLETFVRDAEVCINSIQMDKTLLCIRCYENK